MKKVLLFLLVLPALLRSQDTIYINGEMYIRNKVAVMREDTVMPPMEYAPVAWFAKKKNPDKVYLLKQGYEVSCVMKHGNNVKGEFIGLKHDSVFLKTALKGRQGFDTIGIAPAALYRMVSVRPETYETSQDYAAANDNVIFYLNTNCNITYQCNNNSTDANRCNSNSGSGSKKSSLDAGEAALAVAGIVAAGALIYLVVDDLSHVKSLDMFHWEMVKNTK